MAQSNQDTVRVSFPTVRKVVFRSSLLPGWGQWTNGAKWKAALVVAGEAVLFGVAVAQNQRAQSALGDFNAAQDDMSRKNFESAMLFYRNERSRFLWYAAGLWLLNVLDAFVDAKLRPFDVGPDLSAGFGGSAGLSFSLSCNW
ncbi:hypothetical protein KAR48_07695 [bacterium]|nr:hypothetical protein [bacterium]